jgi:uncharacterized protein
VATVTDLICYPVKGCAGVPVPATQITWAGLRHDRTFMVVSENGLFRSQRREPVMARIRPEISADGNVLWLHSPDTESIRIDVVLGAERRDVELWHQRFQGIDQGDDVAGWLADLIGAPSRLVRVPPEHGRVSDGETPGTSAYADSCAVLLASQSSLDALNARILERGAEPVPMNRFRPNIVVGGWDEPHTEDRVERLDIGEAELAFAKIAVRCAVPMHDQETGEKAGVEPIRTLAGYRRTAEGVVFGSKFAVARPGPVAVGDEVVVRSAIPSGAGPSRWRALL